MYVHMFNIPGPSAVNLLVGQVCQGSWIFLEQGENYTVINTSSGLLRLYARHTKVQPMGPSEFNDIDAS